MTTVLLSSSYFLDDLAEQSIEINLVYTIGSNSFSFPTITATYKAGNSTGSAAGSNQPPVFKVSSLNDPDPIPCLNTPKA